MTGLLCCIYVSRYLLIYLIVFMLDFHVLTSYIRSDFDINR
nr:MAG TPA: hypothetical protein [Caudoviricetes sp.]